MITVVLDHLWQSTLFAAGAGLLTLAYRNNSAQVRYWLWFAASAKFLVPFALLSAAARLVRPLSEPINIPFDMLAMERMTQPFSGTTLPTLGGEAAPFLNSTTIAALIWGIGCVAVLLHWLVRWSRVRAALHAAVPLSLARPVPIPVRGTSALFEPGLVGILRPVLLLPEGILARLSPQEVDAIIAHEMCHLRRRDNLTAAMHMLVEAIFWFYPLVWWLGARLIAERERACDEAVVAAGSDPQIYAEGILKVCRFYVQSPLACASGVSGADLRKRVEEIMINRMKVRLNAAKKILLAATAVAALAAPLVTGFVASPKAAAQAKETMSLEQQAQERAQRRAEQRQPRTAISFDPSQFDKYVGFYQSDVYEFFAITREGEHFFAQPGADEKIEIYPESPTKFFTTDKPIQISFVTDVQGKVIEAVLHANGFEGHVVKVDESVVKTAMADLAVRIKNKTPFPHSDVMLRRYIEGFQKGRPNYDEMQPHVALLTREQSSKYIDDFKKWGALKSLTFVEVDPHAWDKYVAVFEHNRVEMLICPPYPDDKIDGIQIGNVTAE